MVITFQGLITIHMCEFHYQLLCAPIYILKSPILIKTPAAHDISNSLEFPDFLFLVLFKPNRLLFLLSLELSNLLLQMSKSLHFHEALYNDICLYTDTVL